MLRLYPPGSQTRDAPSARPSRPYPVSRLTQLRPAESLGFRLQGRATHTLPRPVRNYSQHQRRSPDRPARSPPTRSAPPRDPGPLHRQASLVAPASPCPMRPPRPGAHRAEAPAAAARRQPGALPAAPRTIPVPMARRHEHCPARPRHGFVTRHGRPRLARGCLALQAGGSRTRSDPAGAIPRGPGTIPSRSTGPSVPEPDREVDHAVTAGASRSKPSRTWSIAARSDRSCSANIGTFTRQLQHQA